MSSEAAFSTICLNVDNFRPEVHSDVMSGSFIGPTGVKVRIKFGYSKSNQTVLEIHDCLTL